MSLDKIISGTNKVINFLPRKLGQVGEKIIGEEYGRYIGVGAGYAANLVIAGTAIGPVTAVLIGIASPASYVYDLKKKQIPPKV